MDDIKRWDLYPDHYGGYMDHAVKGAWVSYEDYEKLRQQRQQGGVAHEIQL